MSDIRRLCYTVDLRDDAELMARYKAWHGPGAVPKPVVDAIRKDGIRDLEIWLYGTRMVLIMEVGPDFDPGTKAASDAANPEVQEWERLMGTFQQPLPGTPAGQTWVAMECIHSLKEQA